MDFENIIGQIAKTDPEIYGRLDSRRSIMNSFFKHTGKITMATLPLALSTMFQKAYGQSNTGVLDVLNYALTLEYLEAAFYAKAVAVANTLIPTEAARNAIATIGAHEKAHVALLRGAITGLSSTPVSEPTFDFTAKGTFPDVFTNYATFLAVAQAFEDTGVRAYKGRAKEIVKGGDLLTTALNIHSVEARHAAHIRYMRRNSNQAPTLKPWITGKDSGIGAVVQAIYDGEEITKQGTVEIVNIGGKTISVNAATEAFDEPLTKAQVLAIVDPFLVK